MGVILVHYNCLYTLILQCVAYIENTTRRAVQLRGATSHHHPLPVEGRPQPTRLRSVARTARKPPRPARRASLTAMPAAPAVYCSAARASQLRLHVAPGSGQSAAPSALRGGSWIPRAQTMSPLERLSALRRIASSAISCVSFGRLAMRITPVKLVSSLTVDSRGTLQRHGKGGAVSRRFRRGVLRLPPYSIA